MTHVIIYLSDPAVSDVTQTCVRACVRVCARGKCGWRSKDGTRMLLAQQLDFGVFWGWLWLPAWGYLTMRDTKYSF